MQCVLGLFLRPGNLLYSLAPQNGGHHVTKPLAERFGLRCAYLPYDEECMDIDFAKLSKQLQQERPDMIYLDLMNVLFPLDIVRLKSLLSKRTRLVFDASHIMALIMGKVYENPLKQGVDILVGSTHKTLPGSHKALFATDNPIINKIFLKTNGVFISSHHIDRKSVV